MPLGAISLSIPDEAEKDRLFTISASCPNAHHIAIHIVGPGVDEWHQQDGTSYSYSYMPRVAGKYTITAAARNTPTDQEPGTERKEVSDDITVIDPAILPVATFNNLEEDEIYIGPTLNISVSGSNCTRIKVSYAICNGKDEDTDPNTHETYTSLGEQSGQSYTRSWTMAGNDLCHLRATAKNMAVPAGIDATINIYLVIPGVFSTTVQAAQIHLQQLKDGGVIPGINLGSAGIDGKWGPDTKNSVRTFQVWYNNTRGGSLRTDGILNRKTADCLLEEAMNVPAAPRPVISFSPDPPVINTLLHITADCGQTVQSIKITVTNPAGATQTFNSGGQCSAYSVLYTPQSVGEYTVKAMANGNVDTQTQRTFTIGDDIATRIENGELINIQAYLENTWKIGDVNVWAGINDISDGELVIDSKKAIYPQGVRTLTTCDTIYLSLDTELYQSEYYATPGDLQQAMSEYLGQKTERGVYQKQYDAEGQIGGIGSIYGVDPIGDYLTFGGTDIGIVDYTNKCGPMWEARWVSRTSEDDWNDIQLCLDILSCFPIAFLPAQGANILIDIIRGNEKEALLRVGLLVFAEVGGRILFKAIGPLFERLKNYSSPTEMKPVLQTVAEAYVEAGPERALSLSTRFLNKIDPLWENAGKITPIEGYQDIICHGDQFGFVWKNADGIESIISANEFAQILKDSPVYNGGPIRLVACEAGADGAVAAQAVANVLGVDVMAPTDIVYVYADGTMKIGINNTGTWRIFNPQ